MVGTVHDRRPEESTMGKHLEVLVKDRREAVLSLLRREETAASLRR
jgi:hypothetical protein